MCGISAIFVSRRRDSGALPATGPQAIGPQVIGSMTDVIRHRGPDDEGFVFFTPDRPRGIALGGKDTPEESYRSGLPYSPTDKLGSGSANVAAGGAYAMLGHRRLSILDLSPTGHQPMCSENAELWIVFNGEIYNYVEIRAELKQRGHAFRTQCDTEVILAAYREWGRDCLRHFNGMFAFVLFDTRERRVFVARDRFGVKPLYYWYSPGGTLAFSSEIKQLLQVPGCEPRLDGQRAYDFLNWGLLDHTSGTLFRDIHQLRGGEFLEFRLDDLDRAPVPERWYQLRPAELAGDFQTAARQFLALLTDSVRLRLRSDVPVGSCLSGGLDSSSIVCLASRILKDELGVQTGQNVFSAFYPEKKIDERRYAREVIAATGVASAWVEPSFEQLTRAMEELVWHQDEPFGSTSIFAQWSVFRLAAENGIRVMLDGQGADELLAGYHGYFAPLFAGLFSSGRFLDLWAEIRAASRIHGYGMGFAGRQTANMLAPEPVRQLLRKLGNKASTTPAWLDLTRLGAQPEDPYALSGAKTRTVRGLSQAQLSTTHLPALLHWEDRNSMTHSVEARVPFLDYRLVEFALGLPDEWKISRGVTKVILREGLRDSLPELVRNRMDKIGFATPEELWLKGEGADWFRNRVSDSVDGSSGIVRSSVMDELEQMISGRIPFSFKPWRIAAFGSWMRRFRVSA